MKAADATENIVTLTAEEHFLAHQLLVKIYPDSVSLKFALHMMCYGNGKVKRNNKEFSWIRKQNAIAVSKFHTGRKRSAETCKRISESNTGRKQTPEGKAKRALSTKIGKAPHSEESLERMRTKLRGQKRTPEQRARMAAAQKARFAK